MDDTDIESDFILPSYADITNFLASCEPHLGIPSLTQKMPKVSGLRREVVLRCRNWLKANQYISKRMIDEAGNRQEWFFVEKNFNRILKSASEQLESEVEE